MDFYIVIPAHNEQDTIALTLDSLVNQSMQPKRVVVVNDNSTDKTSSIVSEFANRHEWISLVENTSSVAHLPGSKIINAFYKGYETLDDNYDVICKYDADLIFPSNYLQTLEEGNELKVESQDNDIPNFEVDSIEKVEPALFSDDEGVNSVNGKETETELQKCSKVNFKKKILKYLLF